jgi:hypothetical protein
MALPARGPLQAAVQDGIQQLACPITVAVGTPARLLRSTGRKPMGGAYGLSWAWA